MIPNSIRVPIPFDYAFPAGALALAVEPVVDFDRRGQGDDQARDENGVRIWAVRVMDLDPNAGKFGRSTEVKVKIAVDAQPVLPPPALPGYPPAVEFRDLTVTPYTDNSGCRGNSKGPHRCRARQAWSFRAADVVAPGESARPSAA